MADKDEGGKKGAIGKAIAFGAMTAEVLESNIPRIEDQVVVTVFGQPGFNKQQLYFLALNAAFGVVRRFSLIGDVLTKAAAALMIEYDAADNWVRCTLQYNWSAMRANTGDESDIEKLGAGVNRFPGPFSGGFFQDLAVYRGPQCEVVGGSFDFISFTDQEFSAVGLRGIPLSATGVDGQAPQLQFTNQEILTPCPRAFTPKPKGITQLPVSSPPVVGAGPIIASPNPKPVGDNRSRGAVIRPRNLKTGPGGVVISGGATPGSTSLLGLEYCCPVSLELVPLIYAALSFPASDSDMRFTAPDPGPLGG